LYPAPGGYSSPVVYSPLVKNANGEQENLSIKMERGRIENAYA